MFWNKKKEIKENEEDKKLLIIGKFIYGIKEIPLDTLTVIENSIENQKLIFTFKINENINKLEIRYDEINDISIKQSVVMSSNKPNIGEETDKEMAMQLMGAAVFGSFGPIIGSELNTMVAGYDKIDYNNIWEVTISYNDKKIIISSNIDPSNYIQKTNHN